LINWPVNASELIAADMASFSISVESKIDPLAMNEKEKEKVVPYVGKKLKAFVLDHFLKRRANFRLLSASEKIPGGITASEINTFFEAGSYQIPKVSQCSTNVVELE
jgi:hypothetical protein